jgi:hypothetical protein
MKKLLVLFPLAVVLCSVPLWGQPPNLRLASRRSIYTDATYGFTVSPPSFPNPANQQFVAAAFTAPSDSGFSSNVNVMITPGATTRDALRAETERDFQTLGFKTNSVRKLTVSGRDALRIDYEGKLQGNYLHFLCLAVIDKDRVIIVTCTAKAEAFAANQAEFSKCLDSFALR